jgi:hypothetical protein
VTCEVRMQELRVQAKASKDFAPVDVMKAQLAAAHVSVMMEKDRVVLRPEIDARAEAIEALTW